MINCIKIDNEAEFNQLMGMYKLKGYKYSGWVKSLSYRPVYGYVTVNQVFAIYSTEWSDFEGYKIIPFSEIKPSDLIIKRHQL